MSTTELAAIAAVDLVQKLELSLKPEQLLTALQQMVFKSKGNDPLPTAEEQAACMMVAAAHGLNPFRKEIYLVKTDRGYQSMISIDGWARLSRDKCDSMSHEYHDDPNGKLVACTFTLKPKGWSGAAVVTEYLAECDKGTPPWKKYPRRMLRHRAFMQAARLAFGVSGVYMEAPDEGDDGTFNPAKANGAPAPTAEPANVPRSAEGMKALLAAPKQEPVNEIMRKQPPGEEPATLKVKALIYDVGSVPIEHNGATLTAWTVLAEVGGARLELKSCDDELCNFLKRPDVDAFDLLVYPRKLDGKLCLLGARVNTFKTPEAAASATAAAFEEQPIF